MDRSTLRTSTPSGTDSTVGAKFRMLVTPAATRRSHTSWAAAAGVAITPIATSCSATTTSSSAVDRILMSPTSSPRRAGSLSMRATIRKPREVKPE